MSTQTADVPVEKRSRWEDLVDVFFAPGDLFEHRANDSWGKPFLLLCVISVVLYYIFLPVNSLMFQAMMTENAPAGATPEQVQKSAVFMSYLGGLFVLFGFLFAVAFSAVVMKLVSAMLEPAASWRQSFTIATYSMFVVIPQTVLATLFVFIKSRSGEVSTSDASFGVLRFMDHPDKVLTALLGRLDLFPLWSAALMAVGLIVVVKMSRTKAIVTAAITWLAIALPALAGAALSGAKK